MERYDYKKAVKEDLRTVIDDEYEELINDWTKGNVDREYVVDILYDSTTVDDSVTGGGSGSYFFNSWKAEEALCHNIELLGEALDELCYSTDIIKRGAEICDVIIRRYLLKQVLDEVIDELEDELDFDE